MRTICGRHRLGRKLKDKSLIGTNAIFNPGSSRGALGRPIVFKEWIRAAAVGSAGQPEMGCFAAAEAFILPSHQENFGIAVVEALPAENRF